MYDQFCFDNYETKNIALQDAFKIVVDLFEEQYRPHFKLELNGTNAAYYSIVFHSDKAFYRDATVIFFARLKRIKAGYYLGFNESFSFLFERYNISFIPMKSGFIRIDLDALLGPAEMREKFKQVFKLIFQKMFNFDEFGCCSRYLECSNEKHCVHPDQIYATACQYGKNLAAGKIFYGKNRNII